MNRNGRAMSGALAQDADAPPRPRFQRITRKESFARRVSHDTPSCAAVLRLHGDDSLSAGLERWLFSTDQLMKIVIDIENGPWAEAEPAHAHPHEQITYVVEGEILVRCEALKPVHLGPGDLYAIPANLPHSIQVLSRRARIIDSSPAPKVAAPKYAAPCP